MLAIRRAPAPQLNAVLCGHEGSAGMMARGSRSRFHAALLLAGMAVSCTTWDPPREAAFVVKPPLGKARVLRDELFVQLAPGVDLAAVVAIQIEPLSPGMTLAQARQLLGDPLATRTDVEGTYYRFRSSASRVELAHLSGPGSDGSRWEKWAVVANPENKSVSAVLQPPLQELLGLASPVREIIIHEHRRPALKAFSADVQDGQVQHLQWYSIDGIPGEQPHNYALHLTGGNGKVDAARR